MEVTGIDKIQSVKKLGRGDAVQSARIEDTLSISSEAQKKAEWVEMLKTMPDVRSEKIDAALASDSLSNPSKVLPTVARQILESEI